MADGAEVQQGVERAGVHQLAHRALANLALSSQTARKSCDPEFLGRMVAASLRPDSLNHVAQDMRDAGISDIQIADLYIPAAARQLGNDWLTDKISFAMTSMGSARLLGLLRQIGSDWCSMPVAAKLTGRPALVIVPKGEQHTLGATILAGQLRRHCVEVQLEVEVGMAKLQSLLRETTHSAVLISATTRVDLESLGKLVSAVKSFREDLPVVVGGAILETESDVRQSTGADHAFSKLHDVLQMLHKHRGLEEPAFCGPGG